MTQHHEFHAMSHRKHDTSCHHCQVTSTEQLKDDKDRISNSQVLRKNMRNHINMDTSTRHRHRHHSFVSPFLDWAVQGDDLKSQSRKMDGPMDQWKQNRKHGDRPGFAPPRAASSVANLVWETKTFGSS